MALKYVATPSMKPVSKIQLNNHRDASSDSSSKKEPAPGKLANGEPVPRKKTLREMLAGVPGFSNKVP